MDALQLSKLLSFVVRHRPDSIGISLDSQGWYQSMNLVAKSEAAGTHFDEGAIDQFIITVVPTFIGEGIPLISPRRREVPLRLRSLQRFPGGVVQLHYDLQQRRR